MPEKTPETSAGVIHYWTNDFDKQSRITLIFYPGSLPTIDCLTNRQILVWDAPGHASSYPFELNFNLFDEAKWLDEILIKEGIDKPILIGQSMGGYLGQVYAELFAEKLKGLVTIDSPPLQRQYYTAIELWLLKIVEPIYKIYPQKTLLREGTKGVSTSEYGRKLMLDMMMVYHGNQERYSRLAGHGYKILAKAVEKIWRMK